MKISWKNFLVRRGVTLLDFMRQSKSKDYDSLAANLKTLGVRPPGKSEILKELDIILEENSRPEKLQKEEKPSVTLEEKPLPEQQKRTSHAPKRRGRRKKAKSE